jgi:alkyl hydroperoxide reductase subunit AhpC
MYEKLIIIETEIITLKKIEAEMKRLNQSVLMLTNDKEFIEASNLKI